ncbi:MAG: hypothetical protein VX589_03915 [Myxococcota bacterium]|nr:hypothetical protein [Myxococcota bacterium]
MRRRLLLVTLSLSGCIGCASTGTPADQTERSPMTTADMGPRDCRINSDCPVGFYCSSGAVCIYDCRESRDCGRGATCQSGRCVTDQNTGGGGGSEDAQARCNRSMPCAAGFVCADGQCLEHCEGLGCPQGDVCNVQTGVCETLGQCGDDECPPGQNCQSPAGGCAVPRCPETECPQGQRCDVTSGECQSEAGPCTDDTCPVGTFCHQTTGMCAVLPMDCTAEDCPNGFGCRRVDRRCVRLPEDCRLEPCPDGFDCQAPRDICIPPAEFDCLNGGCPAGQRCPAGGGDCVEDRGCLDTGCGAGERCNGVSRRCEAIEGDGTLGAACARAAECDSGICIDVAVDNQQSAVCAQLCCSENDCPLGFGCRDTAGVRFCLPSRLYPPGYTFNARAGQSCGIGGTACQSGECSIAQDRCLSLCCNDGDCGARSCVWTPTTNGLRAFCARPLPLGGRTGTPCDDELACRSGVCIIAPTNISSGRCADFCCTSRECPQGYLCGQTIDSLGGQVVSVCVPSAGGVTMDGAECNTDDTCASGHCIEGRCRSACCRDVDCQGEQRCRPRRKAQAFVRVCVPPAD